MRQNIAAAVLAAGQGSRFGGTKQLAKLQGKSLIQITTEHALSVVPQKTFVVLGYARDDVMADNQDKDVFLLSNDHYEDGIGTSIAVAARACVNRFDAMLLTFCDQPLVTAEHLQTLIDSWSGAPDEIVASAYAGIEGPPALFPRDALVKLQELRGDDGARALLLDPAFKVNSVPFEAAAYDVDTPADLEKL